VVASSQMAPKDSLGYARWRWQGYLELLEDPDGYDEVFILAEAEESGRATWSS